ncbi:DUF4476 domain-containing protein [Halocola ammonii]
MQKIVTTLIIAFLCNLTLFAQNSAEAIVFSENGELFTAYLNGRQINEKPANRVKMPNLTADYYKLKLDFEDPGMNDYNSGMIVELGNSITYIAKQNKKGKIVIRPVSNAPLAQESPEQPSEPQRPARPVEPAAPSKPAEPSQEVTTTTTTTTTRGGQDGVKMDMDVAGTKVSVDMRVPDMEMEVEESTTVTTTTTTRTSREEELPVKEEEVVIVEEGGCSMPMSSADFASAKKSIESKSFSDSQFTLAKQITKSNCLKADQVKAIMEIFDFEDTRLEYAKFAYDYTVDQNNYYKVNDAFTFESSIEELDEFIMSK